MALDESSNTPSIATVHETHEFYRLSAAAASRIEQQVRAAFQNWQSIARGMGISRREIERLEAVIDPSIDV